jgi:hypothetical protein
MFFPSKPHKFQLLEGRHAGALAYLVVLLFLSDTSSITVEIADAIKAVVAGG